MDGTGLGSLRAGGNGSTGERSVSAIAVRSVEVYVARRCGDELGLGGAIDDERAERARRRSHWLRRERAVWPNR